MNPRERKQAIEESLKAFGSLPLEKASLNLFETLGYKSEKRLPFKPNTASTFLATFVQQRPFNQEQALVDDWQTVDFLFQLTDSEISSSGRACFLSIAKANLPGPLSILTSSLHRR